MTQANAAAAAARLLVQAALAMPLPRKIHLYILTASRKTEPSVPYQWHDANRFGVSFVRQAADAAVAWAETAIHAGYLPFYTFGGRTGAGCCPREASDMLAAIKGVTRDAL